MCPPRPRSVSEEDALERGTVAAAASGGGGRGWQVTLTGSLTGTTIPRETEDEDDGGEGDNKKKQHNNNNDY